MSVFLKNDCNFGNCGKIFSTLADLIKHIENAHIDFSPQIIEKAENEKPEYLHFSYVLKFSDNHQVPSNTNNSFVPYGDVAMHTESFEYDKTDCGSRKKDTVRDDRLVVDDVGLDEPHNPDFIDYMYPIPIMNTKLMKFDNVCTFSGGKKSECVDSHCKKPFVCDVPGCLKRYKNVNGIKYHRKNFHKLGGASAAKKTSSIKHKTPNNHRKQKIENLVYDKQSFPVMTALPSRYPQTSSDLYNATCVSGNNFDENVALLQNEYFYKYNRTPSNSYDPKAPNQPTLSANNSFTYYSMSEFEGSFSFSPYMTNNFQFY